MKYFIIFLNLFSLSIFSFLFISENNNEIKNNNSYLKNQTKDSLGGLIEYTRIVENDNTVSFLFKFEIKNDEFLNFEEVNLNFTVSSNGDSIKTSYNFLVDIDAKSEYSFRSKIIGFEEKYKVLNLDSWNYIESTIWGTYDIVIIICLSIFTLYFLVIFLLCLFKDLGPSDIMEWLKENYWTIFIVLPIFISPAITLLFNGNWLLIVIPMITIVLTLLSTFLANLLSVGVTNLFNLSFGNRNYGYAWEVENNDFTDIYKEDLIEYVEECGYKIDKKLKKAEIIEVVKKIELNLDIFESDLVSNSNINKSENLKNTKNEISKTEKTENTKENSKNGIRFKDIAGLKEAKESFEEKVILPFSHKELFEKYGKKMGGGILLYGLPGTGKTMFAEAASNEVDAKFFPIKSSDIKSKWHGESEENIKLLFKNARKHKRSIIFFDEFESIGAKRTDDGSDASLSVVPEILAEMQGVGNSKNESVIVVIAATNKPWLIDSALLRPGRFDEKIYIPLPDIESRHFLLEKELSKIVNNINDLKLIAYKTEGYNGADINEICEKSKMYAIKMNIQGNDNHKLSKEELLAVLSKIKSSVIVDEIEKLKEFENSKS